MIVWALGLPRGMTGMAQPDNNPSPFGPTSGSITGLIRSQRAGTDHTRHLTVVWVGPAAACARCCWPVRARMVGAAALSSMVKARAAASNATAAAVTNAQWYAESCGVRWPAIWWVVPIVAMTVVSVAIPTALPSWREALNRVEARPVAAEVMVAKAAACEGANTCAIATPSSSIIARIHHRLVEKPTSVIRLMLVATPASDRPLRWPALDWYAGPFTGASRTDRLPGCPAPARQAFSTPARICHPGRLVRVGADVELIDIVSLPAAA